MSDWCPHRAIPGTPARMTPEQEKAYAESIAEQSVEAYERLNAAGAERVVVSGESKRLVAMTREQRQNIDRMYGAGIDPVGTPLRDLIDAFDAAPADTEATIRMALAQTFDMPEDVKYLDRAAAAVVRALDTDARTP